MLNIIWIFIGVCFTLFWLFLIGGLIRPLKKQYIAFAIMMLINAGYLFAASELYQSQLLETALYWARIQCALATFYIPIFVYFISHGLEMRSWRPCVVASSVLSAAILIANYVMELPFWTPANPRLLSVNNYFGENLHVISGEHNFGIVFWYSLAFIILVIASIMSYRAKRWIIMSATLVLPLLVAVDFINDTYALGWLYFTELGFTAMGILLATSLAIDFRRQKAMISHAMTTAMHVRDQLNTPLQVVVLGLESIQSEKPVPPEVLEKMKNNVQIAVELSHKLRNHSLFPDRHEK